MTTYQHADDPPGHGDDIVAAAVTTHLDRTRPDRQIETTQEPGEDLSWNQHSPSHKHQLGMYMLYLHFVCILFCLKQNFIGVYFL